MKHRDFLVITRSIISTFIDHFSGQTLRSALDWSQQEIIIPFQQLCSWSKHHFGWTLFISLIFNLLVFICFPSSWIPTQIQSKTFDEITIEVGKGRISTLKFKQQHHLWIANCALMGEPAQTLCNQSSPIYGKAGRGLLFGAHFLESKKHQKGGVYSTDHIS